MGGGRPGLWHPFQSTLPVWGATCMASKKSPPSRICFNPRSPCGERLAESLMQVTGVDDVSIHAPRVGSDTTRHRQISLARVSIHAPRVGSDLPLRQIPHQRRCVSIHAPRVGSDGREFYSYRAALLVSIHAPRVGSDDERGGRWVFLYRFNPRSPCGERQRADVRVDCTHKFQSTLPVWGATVLGHRRRRWADCFNPRSPCGERRSSISANSAASKEFQSTLPVWGATNQPDIV